MAAFKILEESIVSLDKRVSILLEIEIFENNKRDNTTKIKDF